MKDFFISCSTSCHLTFILYKCFIEDSAFHYFLRSLGSRKSFSACHLQLKCPQWFRLSRIAIVNFAFNLNYFNYQLFNCYYLYLCEGVFSQIGFIKFEYSIYFRYYLNKLVGPVSLPVRCYSVNFSCLLDFQDLHI